METIKVKLPAISEVVFTTSIEPEYIEIRGNAMASGDDQVDKAYEDEIIRQLENGNEWAWCAVKVTAKWKGLEASNYLGGCSYKDEQDFMNCGYYEDMKLEAFISLTNQIKALA